MPLVFLAVSVDLNLESGTIAEQCFTAKQTPMHKLSSWVTEEKEQRIERIKRLGNAVVPLQGRTAFEHLMGLQQLKIPDKKQNTQEYEYDSIWD